MALGSWLIARPARADLSSWLFVGTGPALAERAGDSDRYLRLDLETGLGTTPENPLSLGGLFKLPIYLGGGADLSLAARLATRGFVTGGYGGAIDLGTYHRFWGRDSTGFSGTLVLGAPLGLTLNLNAAIGSRDVQTYAATLGIDFARLTVHRSDGGGLWPNELLPTPRRD